MDRHFEGFDLANFWEDSEYARESYIELPPSKESIASVEAKLGVRLPSSYVELMKTQNGGIPRNTCFPTDVPTGWAKDHVSITGIFGIGKEKTYSLCGGLGSEFMQSEWGYPEFGICICSTPTAGHEMIMLDYRKSGPGGEPEVIYVYQEDDYKITFLAKDFETFVRGLVNESVYDTSAEDLKESLEMIDHGSFSSSLTELFSDAVEAGEEGYDLALRKLCRTITVEKGHFSLHDDEHSLLVYDLLFYLCTIAHEVPGVDEYLQVYPELIAGADGDFSTKGFAWKWTEDWIERRMVQCEIIATEEGHLEFSEAFDREFKSRVEPFRS